MNISFHSHSDRYKIFRMTRQLCCRGMCKHLLRFDHQERNYNKANFPSNFNCGQNAVIEMGPRDPYQHIAVKIKCLPVCRQHFQIHCRLCKLLYFDSIFTDISWRRPKQQWASFGSGNAWHRIGEVLTINTLRSRQNGRHFADDMFKCIFLNENVWITIIISLKFVPKGLINNNPALFQIMAWHRPGDKPLSEPMMVSLLTHICVTRPQWVNTYLLIAPKDQDSLPTHICATEFRSQPDVGTAFHQRML